jgi:hypothetical protein
LTFKIAVYLLKLCVFKKVSHCLLFKKIIFLKTQFNTILSGGHKISLL